MRLRSDCGGHHARPSDAVGRDVAGRRGAVAACNHVKAHDYEGAYRYVAKASNTDQEDFARDVCRAKKATCAPTRRCSRSDTKVLHADDNEALVRATLQ